MEDYVLKVNEDGSKIMLRDTQELILKILLDFDAICKKYDIEYAIAYGTALGAHRHKGFIPWDDDVDVMMDYENYDKLLIALSEEITDESSYYYHCFENDTRYNVTIPALKFRMKGTYIKEQNYLLRNKCDGDGLFIDIFIISHVSTKKWVQQSKIAYSIFLMGLLVFIENIGINPVALKRHYVNRARHYNDKNQKANSPYAAIAITWPYEGIKDRRIQFTDYFPPVDGVFEGHVLPVPGNQHEFLVANYGEHYEELPPERARKPKHIDDIKL